MIEHVCGIIYKIVSKITERKHSKTEFYALEEVFPDLIFFLSNCIELSGLKENMTIIEDEFKIF